MFRTVIFISMQRKYSRHGIFSTLELKQASEISDKDKNIFFSVDILRIAMCLNGLSVGEVFAQNSPEALVWSASSGWRRKRT